LSDTSEKRKKVTLSTIASGLAIIGVVIIGGIFLTVPALVVACVAFYRKERRASVAMLISTVCVAISLFFVFLSQSLFG
jgi:hypothetical protein